MSTLVLMNTQDNWVMMYNVHEVRLPCYLWQRQTLSEFKINAGIHLEVNQPNFPFFFLLLVDGFVNKVAMLMEENK